MAALIAAGYTVYAVNPLQAARYRERHGVSGATTQKNYVMTAQRAVVKTEKGERQGKWIITAIKPA